MGLLPDKNKPSIPTLGNNEYSQLLARPSDS
jgi:hypothetical protein